MKRLLILITILTLSSHLKCAEDKTFVMKCIPSGGQVPITLYTSTGIQKTDNVDHLDLHEGDIVYIPEPPETTSFDSLMPQTPVKVFATQTSGG